MSTLREVGNAVGTRFEKSDHLIQDWRTFQFLIGSSFNPGEIDAQAYLQTILLFFIRPEIPTHKATLTPVYTFVRRLPSQAFAVGVN